MQRFTVLLAAAASISLVPRLAAQPAASVGFDSLWTWEQGVRNSAAPLWQQPSPTRAQLLTAIDSLQALRAWLRRPEIRAVRTSSGHQQLAWQVSDVSVDMAVIGARLRDATRAAAELDTARLFLEGMDSPIASGMSSEGSFSYIAGVFAESEFSAPVRGDTAVVRALRQLRQRDSQRMFASQPFSLEYADTIPLADRIAGVSYLWSEAKYNFANFDLVPDLDWDAQYRATLTAVQSTPRTADYYRALQKFISALGDGHTDIQVPRQLSPQLEIRPRIVPELIEGRVYIRRIGHPAYAERGLAVGQEIVRIDDIPVIQYGRERIAPFVSYSTPQDRDVRTYTRFLLRGAHGTSARLTIREKNGQLRTIDAPRDTSLAWDVLPPYDLRWLRDNIALIELTTFADRAVLTQFERDLPRLRNARGMILDLRRNDGGNSGIGYSILSHLINAPSPVSAWSTREYRPAFRSWDRPQPAYRGSLDSIPPDSVRFTGPVALLIGPQTFSAAEDFAVAFDVAKRGPLIGEPTGGSTGNPLSLRLPGGGFARICTKRDRYPDGREFVGVGVQPTQLIARRARDLLAGRDPVSDAAIAAILR